VLMSEHVLQNKGHALHIPNRGSNYVPIGQLITWPT